MSDVPSNSSAKLTYDASTRSPPGAANPALQFGRQVSVIVGDPSGKATDFSNLQVRFAVMRRDLQSPNTLVLTIYNPAPNTVQLVEKEFTQVLLSAGYTGNEGVIFRGFVKNREWGLKSYSPLSATDTALVLYASDADTAYNFSTINTTVLRGYSHDDVAKFVQQSLDAQGVLPPQVKPSFPPMSAPRGRAFYGMARDLARQLADNTDHTWSIEDNALQFISNFAYLPGDAIVLNARTGLVGIPQQTVDGVIARCLLNPAIKAGRVVKIDQKLIQGAAAPLAYTATAYFPPITQDGLYRVLAVDHHGDTRDNDFYTDLVCYGVDSAAPASSAVRGYY